MSRDTLSVFHPLDQKAHEYALSGFIFLTGALFYFKPHSLDAPVYQAWHDLGAVYWGLILMSISLLHIVALMLNGKNLKISQPTRILAILSHLGVSLQFAKMFWEVGATWGSITYGFFVPLLLVILGRSVMRYYMQENDYANTR